MNKQRRHKIDQSQIKSDLKKRSLTNEQKTRLRLIADWADGATYIKLAKKFSINRQTVAEWLRYYVEEGLEGLKRALKPSKKTSLDAEILRGYLQGSNYSDILKINSLIELAETKNTNQTAINHNITPQGLLKRKRKFLKGELLLSQLFEKSRY